MGDDDDDDGRDDGPDEPPAEQVEEPAATRALTIDLDTPLEDLQRGMSLGRYVILGRLAKGGMGVVYAAFDPDLDRKIAIKLLRTDPGEDSESERMRVLSEAQAAARVAHPAVVQIHDVGTLDGGVFIAMEYIDGIDLRQWLDARDEPFPWREVLRVFREAGRGLAAAHAAGVVHRDFKPDNVLLGREGRICVLDFGLAERVPEADEPDVDISALREAFPSIMSTHDDSREEITRAGQVAGTPAYMAPEMHVGSRGDAKSDQFSFCVAFYEGLYGERPFSGNRRATLAMEAINNRVRPVPAGADVPDWLRRVLVRGLSPRRSQRYPSMEALLSSLDHDPIAVRRRWVKGVAALGVIGAASGAVFYLQRAESRRCEENEELLVGVWDEPRREALRKAFVASGRPHADDTWRGTEARLDEWVQEWIDYRERACRATRMFGQAPEELMLRRYTCLDVHLQELQAFGRVFTTASPNMIDRALDAALALGRPKSCVRDDELNATQLPAESIRDEIAELRADHDDAWIAFNAGNVEHARARAQWVAGRLEDLDHAPLRISTELLLGRAELALGRQALGEAHLHKAATAAGTAGLEHLLARAWLRLVPALSREDRREEAKIWAEYARSAIDRVRAEELRAELLAALANVARWASRSGDALALFHQALEIRERTHGAADLRVAEVLGQLGAFIADTGELASAERYFERALEIQQSERGPNHPVVAELVMQIGDVHRAQGKHEIAVAEFERGLGIRLRNFGADDVSVARTRLRVADVKRDQGEIQAAVEHYEQASRALRAADSTLDRAAALLGVGLTRQALRQPDKALEALEDALTLWPADPEHQLHRAATEEAIAVALDAKGAERLRASDLAESARSTYAAAGPEGAEALARVDAWLSDREGK